MVRVYEKLKLWQKACNDGMLGGFSLGISGRVEAENSPGSDLKLPGDRRLD